MATTASALPTEPVTRQRSESQFRIVIRRFLRHRAAVASAMILLTILLTSFITPAFFPPEKIVIDSQTRMLPPLSTNPLTGQFHVLGTDDKGRDYMLRLIYAARVSLTIAILVTTISATIGVTLGILAGYFGSWVDMGIRNLYEFVSTFPTLIILLILTSILLANETLLPFPQLVLSSISTIMAIPVHEAPKVTMVVMALALLQWPPTARLMRGMVLSVREQPYIESARSLGASNTRILYRHVFFNALPPIIVDVTLALNGVLVLESSLSFLGFGVQEPTPTWGNMLAAANSNMLNYPWMPLIPGLPILICSLAINFIGDGLRDALDPRQRIA